MARVLVTDGEQRAALAVVRSLGRSGHHVTVCAHETAPLAGASRHCRRVVGVADPLLHPDSFVEEVARAVEDTAAEVLLPVTEASLAALLPVRDRLAAVLPFPSAAAFEQVCDKRLVLERAREQGLDVPGQHVIGSAAELDAAAVRALRFPLVVKPARSVVQEGARRIKTAVAHADDAAGLGARVRALPRTAFPVLLQERIVGPGAGVFLLLWDGAVVASFGHRRLREKPPSGGVSVLCESEAVDAELYERSAALLRSFGWQGVAMVEFKRDLQTGRPFLMEINGRFWGSLQLAIDAGVDFPALLVELAVGGHPAPVGAFRAGLRSRWFLGDVDNLIARLRRTPAELALPPGSPGRLAAVRDFLVACGPGARSEVLRLADPLPAAREAATWLRQLRHRNGTAA